MERPQAWPPWVFLCTRVHANLFPPDRYRSGQRLVGPSQPGAQRHGIAAEFQSPGLRGPGIHVPPRDRSEEHTSELQSHLNLVCRLLLEKKKKNNDKEHDSLGLLTV